MSIGSPVSMADRMPSMNDCITGESHASATAVSMRPRNPISGATDDEVETISKPSSRSQPATRSSIFGHRQAWSRATAATRIPSVRHSRARARTSASSGSSSGFPEASSRPRMPRIRCGRTSGSGWDRANSRCLRWSRRIGRSMKPFVMKSAVGAPFRSRSALVPRVVATRKSSGGSFLETGTPIKRRAATTGGSSPLRRVRRSPAIGPSNWIQRP